MRKLALILLSTLFLAACSNGGKKTSEQQSVISQPDNQVKNQVSTMNGHPGKKVYDMVCLACHMRNGSGVPGMHPPIIESDFVNGDPDALIKIVLNGLKGEMEIKGEVYNSEMPPQAHLTDQQIADVLTFVRGSFGNTSGPITPEQVASVRASK
jgi:mono/diheme cytochrome c family protein